MKDIIFHQTLTNLTLEKMIKNIVTTLKLKNNR